MSTGGSGGGTFTCDMGDPVDADAHFATYAGTYTVATMTSDDCDTTWLAANTYTLTVGASPKSLTITSESGDVTQTWDDVDDDVCESMDVINATIRDGLPFANFVVTSSNVFSTNFYDGQNFPCTLLVQ